MGPGSILLFVTLILSSFASVTTKKCLISGYLMAYTWPISYCKTVNDCCESHVNQAFTIHGLWALNATSGKVINCSRNKSKTVNGIVLINDRDMEVMFEKFWLNHQCQPTYNRRSNGWIWKRQYNKHHSCCDGTTQENYFRKVFEVNNDLVRRFPQHSLLELLRSAGIKPGDKYPGIDYLEKIKSIYGYDVQIKCTKKIFGRTNLLEEIQFCLDSNLQIMNCPRMEERKYLNQCVTKDIYFPGHSISSEELSPDEFDDSPTDEDEFDNSHDEEFDRSPPTHANSKETTSEKVTVVTVNQNLNLMIQINIVGWFFGISVVLYVFKYLLVEAYKCKYVVRIGKKHQ